MASKIPSYRYDPDRDWPPGTLVSYLDKDAKTIFRVDENGDRYCIKGNLRSTVNFGPADRLIYRRIWGIKSIKEAIRGKD